jgi:hypothetical protein
LVNRIATAEITGRESDDVVALVTTVVGLRYAVFHGRPDGLVFRGYVEIPHDLFTLGFPVFEWHGIPTPEGRRSLLVGYKGDELVFASGRFSLLVPGPITQITESEARPLIETVLSRQTR